MYIECFPISKLLAKQFLSTSVLATFILDLSLCKTKTCVVAKVQAQYSEGPIVRQPDSPTC